MKSVFNPDRNLDGVIIEQEISAGHMLAGGKLQDVNERSTVQNYSIGTRLAMDERVFRYCKSVGNLTNLEYPVINSHIIPDDGYEGAITGVPVVGDRTIVINDTGAAGARPVNYFAGAYIHIYSANTAYRQIRKILSSTVGNGVSITVTLDWPLEGVNPLGITTVDVYPSIYSEVNLPGSVSSGEETFVGFAGALLQSGEYGWVQTWGPVNGHYNVKFPGEQGPPGDRECYFSPAGEIVTPKATGTDAYISYQRAGYVIPVTKSAYGSVFIMLQLQP